MPTTRKKQYILAMAAVMLVVAMLPLFSLGAKAADAGVCGPALTWTYNAGTLNILGSGDMENYRDNTYAPWYAYKDDIIRVNISSSVTSIGDFAFYSCSSLKQVSIPNSVKKMGNYAFASCVNLESLSLSTLLESIGDGAFYNCNQLRAVRFPYNLKSIGYQAFYRCESLTTITLNRSLTTLGDSAFAYCKNLIRAEIYAPLTTIPAWTFYGCEKLSVLSMSSTVESLDNYAFKECDNLSNIHYDADDKKTEKLQSEISVDLPDFKYIGYITSDPIPESTMSSFIVEDENYNIIQQTNTTVIQNDNMTLDYAVNRVNSPENTSEGKNSFNITLTVENNDAWDEAIEQIKAPIKEMNTTYANPDGDNTIKVDVYVKNDTEVSQKFLDSLSGRDVKLEITSSSGSTWRVNGSDLTVKEDIIEAAPPKHDFSHTVQEATPEIKDKVGTDDCYQLTFNESMEEKAEILVQLPPTKVDSESNAFLYQVEENGEHTRLQAVKIDDDSVAHFYLASTDKDTKYVIGVNVPGEKTNDVIIPDELMTRYGSALERLEQIQYAQTGKREMGGFTLSQILIITFIILALCIIVIGVIMFFWNKKRLERQHMQQAFVE